MSMIEEKQEVRKRGRPRLEDREQTLRARMPWVVMGMSRSTWFRRQAEIRKRGVKQ